MAPYQVVNGWNLIPRPATPGFTQVDFRIADSVGVVESPYSKTTQTMLWAGADHWEVDLALPAMTRNTASAWQAWLMALRGRANVMQLGDPLGASPQGLPVGVPVVNGAHVAGTTLLNTRGWTANIPSLLFPGDYLQIGYRLHAVAGVSAVSSDSGGRATIEIWPSIREAPPDGNTIFTSNTSGLFRLASNVRGWSFGAKRLVAMSFKCTEAR